MRVECTLPIALCCAGLAYGASRLASNSSRERASAWTCAPLLAHATIGAMGAAAFLRLAFSVHAGEQEPFALRSALFAFVGRYAFAFRPVTALRRGVALLVVATVGPLALVPLATFIGELTGS